MYITIKTPQGNFVTDPEGWLGQSEYFNKLLSKRWSGLREDGSCFVETDTRIFEHILRYLRTGVLPVFYDRNTGHDFTLYQALLEESKYFAIDRLQQWLCERKYLDAIKVHHLVTESQDRTSYEKHTRNDLDGRTFMTEDRYIDITTGSNMDVTIVPITQLSNSFYCPRGKHGKSTEEYCRSCFSQAQSDGMAGYGGWRPEEQLKWCIVRREIVFDHDLCANAYLKDD